MTGGVKHLQVDISHPDDVAIRQESIDFRFLTGWEGHGLGAPQVAQYDKPADMVIMAVGVYRGGDGDTGRWAIFRRRAFRYVEMYVIGPVKLGFDAKRGGAAAYGRCAAPGRDPTPDKFSAAVWFYRTRFPPRR